MNPRLTVAAFGVLFLLMFGGRFMHSVPAGHVGVATLFGKVQEMTYPEGLNVVANPFLNWIDFDVRQTTHKLTQLDVPTRDQLLSKVDLSIQYRVNGAMAPEIYRETGDVTRVVGVQQIPKVRSLIRELGTKIPQAEYLFKDEVRANLALKLEEGLKEYVGPKGIIIDSVLVRGINLPRVLAEAIEKKKEREQAVERQKAELERYATEQLQVVAKAEAERSAAEEEAKTKRILADAKAYEILAINKAISRNPAYIQLQALEALKAMSKDPAAKLYFMDSNAPNPLPLLHMGDATGKR
jgi:regulator of protease activity HflC (stomatin/prohibitin superfamily)